MKVLLVHARYALPGGEERIVDTQAAVLRARGHEVVRYEEANAELGSGVGAAMASVWSRAARQRVAKLLATERPDVMHVHNQFPALSPSVLAAAGAAGVPVVQHLHNARLTCIQPFLVRDGNPCDDCVGRLPYSGVVHRCYRDSAAASAVAAGAQITHRLLRTWHRRVDRFLAVSGALAAVMEASGTVPTDRLTVCHNGLDVDPAPRNAASDEGFALFVGRLSYEKGADLFVHAATLEPHTRFVVAGDGPERGRLAGQAGPNVEFLGHLDRTRLSDVIGRARVVVAPSRGYEPFGLGVVEAAALGVPAIVTRAGALPEVVQPGTSALVVDPSDPAAIAAAVRSMTAERSGAMGRAARADFAQRFSPDAFADRLLAVYSEVLRQAP